MKIFLWIMGLPLAIVAVLFAITNRQVVAMDLWPLPLVVNAPLYLPILAALGFGALFGAIAVWLAAGRAR
ncbi:MAG: LapA family protein, partial [Rhodospirillales bacterium]|nr:LapA family protein [Rhodospirillales bacterium]